MNIYRCSYPGAGRVYVIVAAVHILFDRYHFNMLKNPVQLTDIIERQGPLVTVLGDVMLETHVLPHFGSGLEPAAFFSCARPIP